MGIKGGWRALASSESEVISTDKTSGRGFKENKGGEKEKLSRCSKTPQCSSMFVGTQYGLKKKR